MIPRPRLPPTIRQLLSHKPSPSSSPFSSNDQSLVEINGWIKYIRKQKNIVFALVNDGSCAKGLQAVFLDSDAAKGLTNGTSVKLRGTLVPSPGSGQERELKVDSVKVYGECDPDTYPIQKQSLSTEYIRNNAHFQGRMNIPAAMLRMRHRLTKSVNRYFEDLDFQHVHVPVITSNDCEGAGEAFIVDAPSISSSSSSSAPNERFFDSPSYLTVSTQLHLEALCTSSSLNRIYTLTPCFRAERSMTSRHLAEFWMIEAEWGFVRELEGVMNITEGLVRSVIHDAVEDGDEGASEDMGVLWKGRNESRTKELDEVVSKKEEWARISYTDAIRILQNHHTSATHYLSSSPPSSSSVQRFEYAPQWGQALHSEHEKFLSESHIGGPVFVTNYPRGVKPFYMRVNDASSKEKVEPMSQTVACFDLLIPRIGELAGGSLREERMNMLLDQLKWASLFDPTHPPTSDSNPNTTNTLSPLSSSTSEKDWLQWYVQTRQYGSVPHGGFGLGFERLVMWVCGLENVRECIAMPRWAGRMIL